MTFRVDIRLNVRPQGGVAFIEHVSPFAKKVGLRLRNDAPGMLEGSGLDAAKLTALLSALGELPGNLEAVLDLSAAGLFDDMWVHVTREPAAG